jgi:hypothetical protein
VVVRVPFEQRSELLSPADVQLGEDPLQVAVDRPDRHHEPSGDLTVGEPLRDQNGDLPLAQCKRYGFVREVEGWGTDGSLVERRSGAAGCDEDAGSTAVGVVGPRRLGGRFRGEEERPDLLELGGGGIEAGTVACGER